MAAEFQCAECGRHIVAIVLDVPPDPPLCVMCVALPGWFTDDAVRRALDPDHDGVEAMDRPQKL